jgi:hypothetical protein
MSRGVHSISLLPALAAMLALIAGEAFAQRGGATVSPPAAPSPPALQAPGPLGQTPPVPPMPIPNVPGPTIVAPGPPQNITAPTSPHRCRCRCRRLRPRSRRSR